MIRNAALIAALAMSLLTRGQQVFERDGAEQEYQATLVNAAEDLDSVDSDKLL